MRVPIRVMRPLRLSERTEVKTSVEPCSEGASRAAHSSRPALSDCRVPCSCTNSHWSSRACDAACSWFRAASSMGGHTAVDMAMRLQGTLTRTGQDLVEVGQAGQGAMGGHRLVSADLACIRNSLPFARDPCATPRTLILAFTNINSNMPPSRRQSTHCCRQVYFHPSRPRCFPC